MKDPIPTQVNFLGKKLKARSLRIYLEIVHQHVRVHSHLSCFGSFGDFVLSLREADLTNKETVRKLLEGADSLSSTVYDDAESHYSANQLVALIKKYPFPVRGLAAAAEDAAWEKFLKSEAKCDAFNAIFSGSAVPLQEFRASEYHLEKMRSFITYVLGVSPNLGAITDRCDFGPGANVGIHGNATNKKRKLLSSWSVTPAAFDYARYALHKHVQVHELLVSPDVYVNDEKSFTRLFKERCVIVEHNDITFVPKTTLTRRSIAIEPCLNGYLQKGVDLTMRDFLRKRVDLDLTNQLRNSEMAREGSIGIGDTFSTIDLSSASDSISIGLVKNLLPPDWFYLLDRLRSKSFRYKNKVYPYSKFCSMGNGFCFPLQTLIFAAACHAVGGGQPNVDFRVYGDDIAIRGSRADDLITLLRALGFDTNPDKTFTSGPFRESCGEDYWQGVNVRPVYLDYPLDSLESYFKFHNSTYRSDLTTVAFEWARDLLRDSIPIRTRYVAPAYADITDTAFRVDCAHADFLTSPHTRWAKSLWCWEWKELKHGAVEDRSNYGRDRREVGIAHLYAALSGSASRNTFTVRRKTRTTVRLASYEAATSQWLPPHPL
jgi:hypothetical protein